MLARTSSEWKRISELHPTTFVELARTSGMRLSTRYRSRQDETPRLVMPDDDPSADDDEIDDVVVERLGSRMALGDGEHLRCAQTRSLRKHAHSGAIIAKPSSEVATTRRGVLG
eukprot:826625-Pleurochrysis_carterae.AAC.13